MTEINRTTISGILETITWNNKNTVIAGKFVYLKDLNGVGRLKIKDIINYRHNMENVSEGYVAS